MDDRVRELLAKVRQTAKSVGEVASDTVSYAGKKTGEVLEIAKLNMHIFDLNTEIGALKKDLGQIVYDTHCGSDTDAETLDERLRAIDEKKAKIEEYRARIVVMKQSKVCKNCGESVSKSDKFCKNCGTQIQTEDGGEPEEDFAQDGGFEAPQDEEKQDE